MNPAESRPCRHADLRLGILAENAQGERLGRLQDDVSKLLR
ncbi:MAG: hypothetical protein ACE5GW_05730 [Planctomycetota bacterium]